MTEVRKREKLENQEGQLELSPPSAAVMTHPVIDYGSAAAYAIELRKWLFTTHCWALCHQMATMHSIAYLASCNHPESTLSPVRLDVTSSTPPTANLPNSNQFIQRRTIPSFTRRILAEVIDSIFAFVAKLFIVYFLVELGIV